LLHDTGHSLWDHISTVEAADRKNLQRPMDRRLERELYAIFLAAAGALIDQLVEVGIDDPGDIARRLNRRGFPCWGRPRWSTGSVATITRRRRMAEAHDDVAQASTGRREISRETACTSAGAGLGSNSASM
jgi:hypothetical protein